MAREWKPSPRASELLVTLWDAFYAGDRWVRFERTETARMTGLSLVQHGIAEWDPASMRSGGWYGMRVRISEQLLRENGMTRGIRFFAGATLAELDAIVDAIEAEAPGSTWRPKHVGHVESDVYATVAVSA